LLGEVVTDILTIYAPPGGVWTWMIVNDYHSRKENDIPGRLSATASKEGKAETFVPRKILCCDLSLNA
jgi:hypothetical protein